MLAKKYDLSLITEMMMMMTMPAIQKGLQGREGGRVEQLKLAPSEQPFRIGQFYSQHFSLVIFYC